MAQAKDLLAEYRKKRDFAKTAEPEGAAPKRQGNLFVVQKHDATRLHYDFRIELDGVLKSWAVTKGPSNVPADKRLAVRVEDHPLEYGAFEGTIPEKEYGGGTVMLWDTGTWEPIGDPYEGLSRGDLKLRLNGQRMKGEWVLVHMKGKDKGKRQNWLLIKHKDDYARDEETLTTRFTRSVSTGRSFDEIEKGLKPKKKTRTPQKAVWHSDPDKKEQNTPLPAAKSAAPKKSGTPKGDAPAYRPPQLATLSSDIPADSSDWLFEMKYDGYRCLAALGGGKVRLFTRNGKDWTEQFGALVPAFAKYADRTALIDGELCALDNKGHTDFATLRDHLSNGGPLVYFAFDLLHLDGEDLTDAPLTERKQRLKTLVGTPERDFPIQQSPHIEGNGDKVLKTLCEAGFEGIIAKRADAPYRNKRSRDWLKIKCIRRQEFVIGGWSPSDKRIPFASLLLGTYENGTFTYRGRVGTGFNDEARDSIFAELDKRQRKTSPFAKVPKEIADDAHWVTPDLVCEVTYTELTPDGYLRHPAFIALRSDKPAKDITLEKATPMNASKTQKKGNVQKIESAAGIAAAERENVRLTSPDKIVFPSVKRTKAELIAYYDAVAERMLRYAQDRPLSLVRCPDGRSGACFYQKHDSGGFPKALKSFEVTEGSGAQELYYYLDSRAALFSAVQMNTLEFHIWGSRRDNIEKPDRIVFDVDPDENLDFSEVKDAATDIRGRLNILGLKSWPMVTGGKGIHVIAPLERRADWETVKSFCKAFARKMAADEPDRYTDNMSKAKRKGRLFIDYLRNERGSTAIAPFSLRARDGAPVSVPLSWKALQDVERANQFSLEDAAQMARKADPWTDYFLVKQSITKKMIDTLS